MFFCVDLKNGVEWNNEDIVKGCNGDYVNDDLNIGLRGYELGYFSVLNCWRVSIYGEC